jgi:hypothetical protein
VRQLFSWRFVAAIGAVAALALLLQAVFGDDDSLVAVVDPDPIERSIDVIDPILAVEQSFDFAVDRTTTGYLDVVVPDDRRMLIAPGTLGEISCEELDQPARCVVLADTLGDAVIWFAILPIAPRNTVELPPIVELDDGDAVFDTGWRVPYAPVIERECNGEDFPSFADFLERYGPQSVTIVDLETRQVVAARCELSS